MSTIARRILDVPIWVKKSGEAVPICTELTIDCQDSFVDMFITLPNHTMDIGDGWIDWTGINAWVCFIDHAATITEPSPVGVVYMAVTESSADFRMSAKYSQSGVVNGTKYQGGVVFRAQDVDNCWLVYIDVQAANPTIGLYEVNGALHAYILRDSKPFVVTGEYVEIDVECSGESIQVWVDGGYALGYNSSFLSDQTKVGIWEYQDPNYEGSKLDDFQSAELSQYTWVEFSTVLEATDAGEEDSVYEPSVMYENGVVKMWYSAGGWVGNAGIYYATSLDGINFTKHDAATPVIADHWRSIVQKYGNTYYCWCVNAPAASQVDLYSSADGITWNLVQANVLSLGAGGQWDDQDFGNVYVWRESPTDYRMMYESRGAAIDPWKIGYATSPDGIVWTKYGSNPVINKGRSTGGPFVYKVGSYYYMYCHQSAMDALLPTWIFRYRSTDLINWTAYPYHAMLHRAGATQGEDTHVGQVADPHIVIIGNAAYMYHDATADGTQQSGNLHIAVAISNINAICS